MAGKDYVNRFNLTYGAVNGIKKKKILLTIAIAEKRKGKVPRASSR